MNLALRQHEIDRAGLIGAGRHADDRDADEPQGGCAAHDRIKTAVLSRTMPPWGAIKGFGEFRNDQGLTQEQSELIVDWIQNDAPRGNNRRALPKEPSFAATAPDRLPAVTTAVSGEKTLDRALVDRYRHPFLLRKAVRLPAGTVIGGVPRDAGVALLAH